MAKLKPGSQYDARASVASRVSGWRWNRLDFYSSVASWALASVQPIRLSKNLMSEMQFDWWKKTFFRDAHDARGASVILWTRLNTQQAVWYIFLPHACRYRNKFSATWNSYTFSTIAQRLFQFRLLKSATELKVLCVGVHFFLLQVMDGNWKMAQKLCMVVNRTSRPICKYITCNM